MTHDPDTVSIKLSNAARMVLNAIATETGPLFDAELFLAGCDTIKALSAISNTLDVGEKQVDIPKALDSVAHLGPDEPQRIGIEQLADKWRVLEQEIKLPRRLAAVLVLQMDFILREQSKGTRVNLPLTRVCGELVAALDALR